MSEEIVRLTAEDFDEAMETMGRAFSFEAPLDFPMLLPQIYRPTDEWMRCNYAIRRDGKIVSVVGVFPRDWQVGDTVLRLAGIGGVCTLEEYRGQGLMKAQMDHCVADMKSDGYHLSWLGGQRQRYQYYGYEKCGLSANIDIRPGNLRHARGQTPEIEFIAMGQSDHERVAVAQAFHESKPIRVNRIKDEFTLYLLSGYCEPWFALDTNENVIGYLTVRDNAIREIAAKDVDTELDILHAWVARVDSAVRVQVQPSDVALHHQLGEIGEGSTYSSSGNWQVFDWSTTLTALMKVKQVISGLADGKVCLGVDDSVYTLSVEGDDARCELSDSPPDITLTVFEAHRVLFGPSRPSDVTRIPKAARLLESWCPLPLSFLRADSV